MLNKKIKFITLPVALVAGFACSGATFGAEYLADSSGEKVRNTARNCWQVKSGLDSCDGAKVITLSGSGLFDTGQATIRPDLVAGLNRVVASASGKNYNLIQVIGHTDNVGSDTYNHGLSQRRAAAAGAYLASRGLNASKIRTAGMGEAQPVASNDTDVGRQQNRRVVITIN